MHDLLVRFAVRSLIVALLACLVATLVAACILPIPGYSMTASGVALYALAVMFPGAAVFVRPDRAPLLAAWAMWNVFASAAGLLTRGPVESLWLRVPLAGAICLAIVGPIVMGFAVSAARRRAPLPTARTRRIQSVVQLACLVAGASVVATWIVLGPRTWEVALMLTLTIALLLAPAFIVQRSPGRASATMWACWSLPLVSIYMLAWRAANDETAYIEAGPKLLLGSYGTLVVVIAVILPLVAFVSSDKTELPEARVQ